MSKGTIKKDNSKKGGDYKSKLADSHFKELKRNAMKMTDTHPDMYDENEYRKEGKTHTIESRHPHNSSLGLSSSIDIGKNVVRHTWHTE